MNTNMPKKLLPLCILRILETYTDRQHRILQKDLQRRLEEEYGIICDRKTVQQNVNFLQEFGYEIEYREGYYLSRREFEEEELRLLMESVMFSRSISEYQASELTEKLKKLGSTYFQQKLKHVRNVKKFSYSENRELYAALEQIDDAIENDRKVAFYDNRYGTDMMLHPVGEKKCVVSPYEIIAENNRYYIICHEEDTDYVGYYRLDRITNIEIREEKRRPVSELEELGVWRTPDYEEEGNRFFSGANVSAQLEAKKEIFPEIIDTFGKDFTIVEDRGETVIIRVECSEAALCFWIMKNIRFIEILSPESMREKLYQVSQEMLVKNRKRTIQ